MRLGLSGVFFVEGLWLLERWDLRLMYQLLGTFDFSLFLIQTFSYKIIFKSGNDPKEVPMTSGSFQNSGNRPTQPKWLKRPFSLSSDCDMDDPLIRVIMEEDLKGLDTPLGLMKRYADQLNEATSHGDIDEKLDKLFLSGRTPEPLDGYYHGVTISLKTGTDAQDKLSKICSVFDSDAIDPLQIIYGRLLSKTSPWAGKNFTKLNHEKLSEMTQGFETGDVVTCLGTNSFRRANKDFLNNLAGNLLSTVIDMEGVPGPDAQQHSWIFAKGGLFLAKKQESVDPMHPEKEVIALNYRWKSLGNKLPNRLLIDEIVEIAEGLYLGQLFYATSLKHMSRDFDPHVKKEDNKYRSFGYFLLMDDSWEHEKNMLFPDLTYKVADDLPEKFNTCYLTDSSLSEMVKEEMGKKKTILHYLQDLSRGVTKDSDSEIAYFDRMHRLFMCGRQPKEINGFYHGGVVAFKSSGFMKKLGKNILNDLWPLVRPFSPWTGKTFTPTTVEKVEKYIGADAGYYKDAAPLILGTNTYRKDLDLSLGVTAFIEHLDAIGMAVEYPDEDEKQEEISVKSFFFVAKNAPSTNPDCNGKIVLQFNYRWPELHTMPPDNLCIDELVQIADGLYLGQLLYSVKPEIPYSPEKEASAYQYEHFGYFMLMDDDWWSIKEFICFDTEK